jgi:phenylpyruvate tautomerase
LRTFHNTFIKDLFKPVNAPDNGHQNGTHGMYSGRAEINLRLCLFTAKKASAKLNQTMPLLKLETTAVVAEDKRASLLAALSRIVAETTGKPEQYVMVTLNLNQAAILMAGKPGGAAFVDIRGIGGLNAKVNSQLSQKISELLKHSLDISPDRIYLNFTDVAAENWGWNGQTFG